MKPRPLARFLTLASALLAAGAMAADPAATPDKPAPKTVIKSEDLGGKERYVVAVSTDKPIYREKERVYGRAVLLTAMERTPLAQGGTAMYELLGPKGERVAGGATNIQDSVAGFYWDVPEGAAGGEYTMKVTCPQFGTAPAVRKFDVRVFRAPRLKTQIKFLRDGYGPGDTVNATLEAFRAEGGAPENAKVRISARVDGDEVYTGTGVVDGKGTCTTLFNLPAKIERGDGTLAFAVEDGGVVETATKTIPILLQTLDISLYPEGGDLVAGLSCRVYVEGRTPAQKPADIAGSVVDAKGNAVAAFRTEHEGRGRFVFIPEKGQTYALKVLEPAGIAKSFPLPAVKDSGTVLRTVDEVYPKGEAIRLRVGTTERGPLTVTLRKFETEVAALNVRGATAAGQEAVADVSLTPPMNVDGILIATVWSRSGQPLAERLLFREPLRTLLVDVKAARPRYVPADKVTLTVTTTDEDGMPLGGVVGVTVTDDSVLEMIDKREQAPRLPAMIFLENDVRELQDAHVYLDPKNAKAPAALDLLLGTQGWRRFAFVDAVAFLTQHGEAGRRLFAMRTVTARERALAVGSRGKAGVRLALAEGAAEIEADAMVMADEAAPGAVVMKGKAQALPAPAMPPAPEAPPPAPAAKPMAARPAAAPAKVVAEKKRALEAQDALRAVATPAPAASVAAKELQGALAKAEVAQEEVMGFAKDAERLDRRSRPVMQTAVREYAHPVRQGRQPNDRVDFTETVYWCAGVKTDAKSGQATVSFDLNDAVTGFRVFADAFAANGALGSGSALVESMKPFYVEPKLPLEVTMGDRIQLPLAVVNGTLGALDGATLKLAAAKGLTLGAVPAFNLKPDARVRQLVDLAVGDVRGEMDFSVEAAAGPYSDNVTRKMRIAPRGFPVTIAKGAMLVPDGTLTFKLTVPATRVPGSLTSDLAIYPSPAANLTKALERLLCEPYGCFEQTSSTTYPVVMVQQYFTTHQGVDPKLMERGQALLKKGYDRLTGFECKQRGYEWFGQDPGHEALTAYGLLEFSDMAQVYSVDKAMLQRTHEWLLAAKDGSGGFKRQRRALHTWIEDKDCSNGYITWALLMAGEKPDNLRKEIDKVKESAKASSNSYVIGIGATIALADKDTATAKTLMDKLAAKQADDGHVAGGTATIVGSGGTALDVETTAFALLAWIGDKAYMGNVEKGMKWLANICEGGRYGSTQATVLALRAIIAYDAARSKPKAPGAVQLIVDGRKAGSEVKLDPKGDSSGAISLTDIAELLEPGDHTVEIRTTGGSEMPVSLNVKYTNDKPDSSDACKVGVKVSLSNDKVEEGKVTEANVTVTNRAEDEIIPTPIAIIGIPGGLEVRHDQLKELVKAGRIAAYEVLGREVVLYWRELKAQQKVELPLSLVGAIPGTYTAPASRAYLYYTDEFKQWADPLKVTISATR